MKKSKCSTVLSTDQLHSVRTLICSSLPQIYLKKPFTLPLLRVGRLVVEFESRNPANWLPRTQRAMLVRTLIAVHLFRLFLPAIFHLNTQLANTLVMDVSRFYWKRLRRKSIREICRMTLSDLQVMETKSFIFQYPNTLLIDSSLSSKDILGLLVIRFLSFYQEALNLARLSETPLSFSQEPIQDIG